MSSLFRKCQVCVFAQNHRQWDVLLLKTNRQRGSFWQNITGSVEANETTLDAAQREFAEETGLKLKVLCRPLKYSFSYTDSLQRSILEEAFLVVLPHRPETIVLDPNEHQDYKWANWQSISLADYKFASNFEVFKKAKQNV